MQFLQEYWALIVIYLLGMAVILYKHPLLNIKQMRKPLYVAVAIWPIMHLIHTGVAGYKALRPSPLSDGSGK